MNAGDKDEGGAWFLWDSATRSWWQAGGSTAVFYNRTDCEQAAKMLNARSRSTRYACYAAGS